MSDLVQRLREAREPGGTNLSLWELAGEAADEIERTKLYDTIAHANKVQAEEIERLTHHLTAESNAVIALTRELADWRTWGTIEVAIRNPNVASYMEHWEGRATKAEAEVDRLRAALKFYADRNHYGHFGLLKDDGKVAREALAGEKHD